MDAQLPFPIDNVILLGAGASAEAGIPVMSQFVELMWKFAVTGRSEDGPLKTAEVEILKNAIRVRDQLDGYHGRARFDDRSIEDILSILAFEALASESGRADFEVMTRAISQTIEIACQVRHSGKIGESHKGKRSPRHSLFWNALLRWCAAKHQDHVAILTLNYDLVLERSLLHYLSDYHNGVSNKEFPWNSLTIDYHTNAFPIFQIDRSELPSACNQGNLTIHLLKLHGSLNFDRQIENFSIRDFVTASQNPIILPPIFNKATSELGQDMWQTALAVLRSAKNIVICGYSLPATDIYMQYFLKCGVGPNRNLDRIFVYNPAAADLSHLDHTALQNRFASCFSPQMQGRIVFTPPSVANAGRSGTFAQMAHLLMTSPNNIFFS